MREGDIFSHTARPEWGLGVVVTCQQGDPHCEVVFEDHGRVKLARAVAEFKLQPVSRAEVPATSGLLSAARWPEVESRAIAPRCDHCREPLHESVRDTSGEWKSCPKCSTRDGHQHVFRAYPDGFGQAAQQESEPTAAPTAAAARAQGHCIECRPGRRKSRTTGRPCGEVMAKAN